MSSSPPSCSFIHVSLLAWWTSPFPLPVLPTFWGPHKTYLTANFPNSPDPLLSSLTSALGFILQLSTSLGECLELFAIISCFVGHKYNVSYFTAKSWSYTPYMYTIITSTVLGTWYHTETIYKTNPLIYLDMWRNP